MSLRTSNFGAAVQYRDWFGECKADDSDFNRIRDYMESLGLTKHSDFVIGIRTYNGENGRTIPGPPSGQKQMPEPVYVTALLITAANFEEARALLNAAEPIAAREVSFEVSVDDFAMFFKRFSIAVAWGGLNVLNRDFSIPDAD